MAAKLEYDFIVVGAGPAGCSAAWQLSKSKAKPSVLLVEAGGENDDVNLRVDGNKYTQMLEPSTAWGYVSAPEESLGGRSISLARGKGLGGTSGVNFTVWNVGPEDDWNHMARVTGDDAWRFERASERWKALQSFHGAPSDLPPGGARYVQPRPGAYGTSGPLHVAFPYKWDAEVTDMLDVWEANGYPINTDVSGGNPLGVSVMPLSSYRGVRTTAADLVLPGRDNLYRMTGAPVRRVVFDGDMRAAGVELVDGRTISATKEVVLSAGSMDTPKILMHSGIGPRDQLDQFGIPVLHENEAVGQNYRDHYHILTAWQRTEESTARPAFYRDEARQRAAEREWQLFRTGEKAWLGCGISIGYVKSEAVLASAEFAALPAAERERLAQPTVPSYELCFNITAVDYFTHPQTAPAISTVIVFVHNTQGKGQFRLRSADPREPLEFRPDFVRHPYDRRVAVEATRDMLRVVRSEAFQKNAAGEKPLGCLAGPKSDSEEDILAYWRDNAASTWHMSCTCKMGRDEKADEAVVDTDFRVFGTRGGLRVADMSVTPILVSAHTQAAAYQVGLIAAEKLIEEYGLDA